MELHPGPYRRATLRPPEAPEGRPTVAVRAMAAGCALTALTGALAVARPKHAPEARRATPRDTGALRPVVALFGGTRVCAVARGADHDAVRCAPAGSVDLPPRAARLTHLTPEFLDASGVPTVAALDEDGRWRWWRDGAPWATADDAPALYPGSPAVVFRHHGETAWVYPLGDGSLWLRVARRDTELLAGGSRVTDLVADDGVVCAATAQREVRCWNDNALDARLRSADRLAPEALPGLRAEPGSLRLAGDLLCAMDGSTPRCARLSAELDPEQIEPVAVPLVGFEGPVTAVEVGALDLCVRNARGTTWCAQGLQATGRPRYQGSLRLRQEPALRSARALRLGDDVGCALWPEGTASCWGPGLWTPPPSDGPWIARELTRDATDLAVGARHACALREGTPYCWGDGENGGLGDPAWRRSAEPVPVRGLRDAVRLGTLGASTFAVDARGQRWFWGREEPATDAASEVFLAPTTTAPPQDPSAPRGWTVTSPARIAGLLRGLPVLWRAMDVRILAGWDDSVCAALDREVYCTGLDAERERHRAWVPVEGVGRVSALGAGDGFGCALREDRRVVCWGRDHARMLSQPPARPREPTPLSW